MILLLFITWHYTVGLFNLKIFLNSEEMKTTSTGMYVGYLVLYRLTYHKSIDKFNKFIYNKLYIFNENF